MSKKRKICVVSGTRADYGLLTPLMHEINNDEALELQLIVTGMHLSPEFGLTYKVIEADFNIDRKIDILLSSDHAVGISKSMGLAQISFAEAYEDLKPDIVLVLGDRFEIFSAVAAAMILRLPIAHLSGGELTEGAIDDSIRHAITKMSHLHFVATEAYRKRVMQLGENPNHIYNFGEAGLDNIKQINFLSRSEFEESINFKLDQKSLLITYHPTTLDNIESIEKDFQAILTALDQLQSTSLIFTKANADEGGRRINQMIDDYVSKHQDKACAYTSLGQVRYLSALKYVDAVVGNTSSGIVEAPSFKIGTINIGDRQKGRVQADNVINTPPNLDRLNAAFEKLYSNDFQNRLKQVTNPYGQGDASLKTKTVLKTVNLDDIIKKEFKDVI